MSLEDPFFVVKEEVEKAVNTSEGLYQRWTQLLEDTNSVSKEEYDWTMNELRNSLRSIEWDVEDLEETISIVEANPRKFRIEPSDLDTRRLFVTRTKDRVREMKEHMSSPGTKTREDKKSRQSLLPNGPGRPKHKYSRLEQEAEDENQRFIRDSNQQQQLIMESQDDQIDRVADSVGVLKNMSHSIGNELDEQAVMLDDFSTELENTESRLDGVMKKMAKVTRMSNDKRQWMAIAVLLVVMLIVIILFFI
ncbi:syntaxin-6 [Strongylocentrotus purpuratus]|uniref:t-SNARE coiled-coil homology domain-containing protein n=1 Tax=Strongylocentrotus purpuratus TaxID=7668 RepID=A0A7M7PM17_STRPU|nr:syntaxin-6 [Strongylocentrotus purpuratus]XP_030853567.1 syntaxin-6 [Strongylocentrotus purpuratus]